MDTSNEKKELRKHVEKEPACFLKDEPGNCF